MPINYADLIRMYFERSTALQWYWTLYVIVIGGLLAFSLLRTQADRVRMVLITILYLCFAYKNLGSIGDVTAQRLALVSLIKNTSGTEADPKMRATLEPTLVAPEYEGVRNFHVSCDVLTVAALWAMERRRRLSLAGVVAPDASA